VHFGVAENLVQKKNRLSGDERTPLVAVDGERLSAWNLGDGRADAWLESADSPLNAGLDFFWNWQFEPES
jgi:hypothetical protein